MTEGENEMLDIFTELSTAYREGKSPRLGGYADRAITILNQVHTVGFNAGYEQGEIAERRKLTTEFSDLINQMKH